MKYACELVCWSAIGHTPLTNRGGAHCDELARKMVNVKDHADAKSKLIEFTNSTEHAVNGHAQLSVAYPNQNYRSQSYYRATYVFGE